MPTKQFGLVLDGTWHDVRRNTLMENGPEKVSNVQKTKKEALKRCADMTIYTRDWCPQICTTNLL